MDDRYIGLPKTSVEGRIHCIMHSGIHCRATLKWNDDGFMMLVLDFGSDVLCGEEYGKQCSDAGYNYHISLGYYNKLSDTISQEHFAMLCSNWRNRRLQLWFSEIKPEPSYVAIIDKVKVVPELVNLFNLLSTDRYKGNEHVSF